MRLSCLLNRGKVRALRQYMRMRADFLQDESCEWLFVTPRAERKMTDSCLNMLFTKLKKELSLVGEKVSSHTWRHTFAKNYLLNGGDVFSLQEILGHADIETTKGYLNLNEEEIKMQHAKFNPLDNTRWLY
ncbi:Phage integrase family protein (fragment) [uncultured Sporomusa sp.]|uniref:Phage integrase family protein n=1 Tax=uncultured Sporomusa sp. TaxID=307249 RepID=A0A212M1M7_9FIRM